MVLSYMYSLQENTNNCPSIDTSVCKCNLACRSYASDRKSSRARNLLEQSLATLTRYEWVSTLYSRNNEQRLENLPLRMDCIESYCALMLSEQEYIAIEPYLFELLTSREEHTRCWMWRHPPQYSKQDRSCLVAVQLIRQRNLLDEPSDWDLSFHNIFG